MAYDQIGYEIQDRVATITLNRPEKMNAWTLGMDTEYRAALTDAGTDPEVRVIVVTGSGRAFCAGADMGLLASAQDGSLDMNEDDLRAKELRADLPEDFQKPYSFPAYIPKPIIAAVNGHAMGLGMVHALFADIRFASDQANLATLFARRGLIAEHGIAWILPRLIGFGPAMELLLSGRNVDAEEALRLGLVHRVVPHDELLYTVHAYARNLAETVSPRSMAVIKRQTWDSLLTGLGPAVDTANHAMFESFASPDFAEGLMAFLEKRKPVFPDFV
jgi:enoyl-CoA hydratase/carnithine racemase